MDPINIALIGCGNFARHTHLGNLRSDARYRVHCTVDVNLDAAQSVAETAGAAYWTDDLDRALADPAVRLAFIATPHHTHAELSVRAARAGKDVFCEKPMGLSEDECAAVAEAVRQAGVRYFIGHNRTFAPFTQQAIDLLRPLGQPMLICHRFADWNPYSRGWLLDEKLSGGRVLGEGGHALDMMCQLTGQSPVRVYAEGANLAATSPTGAADSALITVGFPDGSSGVLCLSSVGNNGYPKEEVVITCANHTVAILNFERMTVCTPQGQETVTLPKMDKGHHAMLDAIARALLGGEDIPNGVDEAWRTACITFAAARSIREHALQQLTR
jgi:predicted dehydrogenase